MYIIYTCVKYIKYWIFRKGFVKNNSVSKTHVLTLCLCVCLSICLDTRPQYCVITAKLKMTNWNSIVFWCRKSLPNSSGVTHWNTVRSQLYKMLCCACYIHQVLEAFLPFTLKSPFLHKLNDLCMRLATQLWKCTYINRMTNVCKINYQLECLQFNMSVFLSSQVPS